MQGPCPGRQCCECDAKVHQSCTYFAASWCVVAKLGWTFAVHSRQHLSQPAYTRCDTCCRELKRREKLEKELREVKVALKARADEVTAKEEDIVAEQEHVRQAESKLHETRVRILCLALGCAPESDLLEALREP